MAFTGAEQKKILFYCGMSPKMLDPTSDYFYSILPDRLSVDSDSEAIVRDLLAKIDQSRADIELAKGRLKASQVDTIKLNENELSFRWREDRRIVKQLASFLDIPNLTASGGATMGV